MKKFPVHNVKERLSHDQESGFYGSILFLITLTVFQFPLTMFCSLLLYVPVYLFTGAYFSSLYLLEFSASPFDIAQLISFLLPLIFYLVIVKQFTFLISFLFSSAKLSFLFNCKLSCIPKLIYLVLILTILFFWSGLPISTEEQSSIFNLLLFVSPSYWISEILLQQQFLSELLSLNLSENSRLHSFFNFFWFPSKQF